MDKSLGIFIKLLDFIQHPNLIRKRGALGVIRCAFWDELILQKTGIAYLIMHTITG
jgi:hypothetical protein